MPAHVSSPALPAPPASHNICNHGNILVLPGPSVVQHASIESQPRVWRNMPKTHPGNAACRAELSEPCSGDQRGRGLAFNPNRVVGSDRDAASNGAGSGPYQTLPGCSVVVVKHGGTISLRVDRSSTDFQGGLQEQTRGQPGSSKPRAPPRRATERVGATSRDQGLWIPWGPLTQTHAQHTATPLAATTDQPNTFRMKGHSTNNTNSSQPMPNNSMQFNIPRQTCRIPKLFQHLRVPTNSVPKSIPRACRLRFNPH